MTEIAPEPRRLCWVQLNEFNAELARALAERHDLPHLRRVLALPASRLSTDDREETGFLEPWAQWVSVHTGSASSVHGIKHLGDVDKLARPQVWERLSEAGVSSGAWGVMNATRGGAAHCRFFLPDPWTFSEPGYPAELEELLALPRYAARNYLKLSKRRALRLALRLLRVVVASGIAPRLVAELPRLLGALARFGAKHFVFISFFDYASTLLFLRYKRRFDPQLSILFMNSVAHAQHHHWTAGATGSTPQLEFAYRYADRCLGLVEDALAPDEALLVMNGLTQTNTNHEEPWILYRPYDPERFLAALGVDFERNEQLMTHDSHLFLASPDAREAAFQTLKSACVDGDPLFFVEPDPEDACRLFYRVEFTREVGDGSHIEAGGVRLATLEWLCPVVVRTGRHVPRADAFRRGIALPDELPSTAVASHVLAYFDGAERT
ncbi:MAG: hypothetical protein ACQGVC_00250 [Myxococcota bacterium]